ncbi:suppressor of loss of ypt1 [Orbilia brochopaga]|uniref:Suppressor of loss of ypt1 n=1 Tax=Orbilia brochopaga TaxID=3140254 RepID=A0AAV9URR1_9PEZI
MRPPQSAASSEPLVKVGGGIGINGGSHITSNGHGLPNGIPYGKRESSSPSREISPGGHRKLHGRTNSIQQAINTIRKRSGSTAEIVEKLKTPISYKLVAICICWYFSSALTNTSSKSILNAFKQPVTLTIVQFAFVTGWCLLLSAVGHWAPGKIIPGIKGGLKYPSREIIRTTAPLALFQVGGHITSSFATSRIPVSLVHTIKGLSPVFTVFAYRFFYDVRYPRSVYGSLVPLTVGVMLACSFEFRGNFIGIVSALAGTVIFVTQNIVSKKIFNNSARADYDRSMGPKLDKLNLLAYSSGLAFLLTTPLWLSSEGFTMLNKYRHGHKLLLEGENKLSGWALFWEFVFNGTSHFGQNIIAFAILSMVEPVTYSVASLIKRIFVIVMAIVWFGNMPTRVQGVGIVLTFLGLYLYDKAKDLDRREKAKMDRQPELLPTSIDPKMRASPVPPGMYVPSQPTSSAVKSSKNGGAHYPRRGTSMGNGAALAAAVAVAAANAPSSAVAEKKAAATNGYIVESGEPALLPGTRQESTWKPNEVWVNGAKNGITA